MVDEVKVLDSNILRQYASRLDGFSSSVQSSCRKSIDVLSDQCQKARNIKNDIDVKEQDANRKVQELVDYYEQVIKQYNLYGENITRLGTSNSKTKMKLIELQQIIESIRNNINIILSKSESLQERMKNLCSHIDQVSKQGIESLRQQATVIEMYKATKNDR